MLEKMVKSRNKKGFTLMEMLIVIAIIAILIAIATPVLMGQLKKAKAVADGAQLSNANSIAAIYVLEKSDADHDLADTIKGEAIKQGIPKNGTLDGGELKCEYDEDSEMYVFTYGDNDMKYYQNIAQGGNGTPEDKD